MDHGGRTIALAPTNDLAGHSVTVRRNLISLISARLRGNTYKRLGRSACPRRNARPTKLHKGRSAIVRLSWAIEPLARSTAIRADVISSSRARGRT
jgi:hypothetical protein